MSICFFFFLSKMSVFVEREAERDRAAGRARPTCIELQIHSIGLAGSSNQHERPICMYHLIELLRVVHD
jgi:hypothetical protein